MALIFKKILGPLFAITLSNGLQNQKRGHYVNNKSFKVDRTYSFDDFSR